MYYLTKMIPFHCKRGPSGCDTCREMFEEGEKFCILNLEPNQDEDYPVARPVYEITEEVEDIAAGWYEFDFVGCFPSFTNACQAVDEDLILDPELKK